MGFELDDLEPTGSGVLLNPQQLINHLLLIWAIEYIEHSPTRYTEEGKPCDVIVVDCVDLDQVDPVTNQPGLVARGCWWRQNRLIMNLKEKVGNTNPVLVKLIKIGQPYDFEQMKNDRMAVTRCNNWFQNNPDFKPSPPKNRKGLVVAESTVREPTYRPGSGPLAQVQETPLEREARLAAGQDPANVTLERLRSMGRFSTTDDNQGPVPF